MCAYYDLQVVSCSDGMKIGVGCAATGAVLDRCLQAAAAFKRLSVEIRIQRKAHLLRRLKIAFDERIPQWMARHGEWSIGAMVTTSKRSISFCPYKIGQNLFVAPAEISQVAPVVIVFAGATNIDHVID